MTGGANGEEPTLGEIGRALTRVEAGMESMRGDLTHLTDKFVSKESFVEWKANLDAQIKELQDWKTWALRIVIGAVMLAMLGLVLANAAGHSTVKSSEPGSGPVQTVVHLQET